MFQDIELARSISIILVLIFLIPFSLTFTRLRQKEKLYFLSGLVSLLLVASFVYRIFIGDGIDTKFGLVIWGILGTLSFVRVFLNEARN